MKIKTVIPFVCLSFFSNVFAAEIIDNFDGSAIDTSLWQPRTPFPDSSITLTGGTVIFLNHGELLSKSDFASSLEVRGRFRFTGNVHDLFTVAVSTSGAAPD